MNTNIIEYRVTTRNETFKKVKAVNDAVRLEVGELVFVTPSYMRGEVIDVLDVDIDKYRVRLYDGTVYQYSAIDLVRVPATLKRQAE